MKVRETTSRETEGFVERGLKWDIGFNRKLGIAALIAAGGAAVAGAPMVGAKIAMFAGASFVTAEIEQRLARTLEK